MKSKLKEIAEYEPVLSNMFQVDFGDKLVNASAINLTPEYGGIRLTMSDLYDKNGNSTYKYFRDWLKNRSDFKREITVRVLDKNSNVLEETQYCNAYIVQLETLKFDYEKSEPFRFNVGFDCDCIKHIK